MFLCNNGVIFKWPHDQRRTDKWPNWANYPARSSSLGAVGDASDDDVLSFSAGGVSFRERTEPCAVKRLKNPAPM